MIILDKYCEPLLSELLNLRISGNIDSNNISYTCMEGFQPTEEVIAFCNSSSGHWNPNPRNHNCMEIPPSTKGLLLYTLFFHFYNITLCIAICSEVYGFSSFKKISVVH